MPVTQPVQHCGSSILVLPAITGSNGNTNRWYDAVMGGNLLAQSVTYTTPVLSGPVTYWVSSYNDTTGCESNRVPLAVQIDPVPGLPVAADSSRCGEGFLTLNSSLGTGGTINRWYDAAVAGNLLDTTLSFTYTLSC